MSLLGTYRGPTLPHTESRIPLRYSRVALCCGHRSQPDNLSRGPHALSSFPSRTLNLGRGNLLSSVTFYECSGSESFHTSFGHLENFPFSTTRLIDCFNDYGLPALSKRLLALLDTPLSRGICQKCSRKVATTKSDNLVVPPCKVAPHLPAAAVFLLRVREEKYGSQSEDCCDRTPLAFWNIRPEKSERDGSPAATESFIRPPENYGKVFTWVVGTNTQFLITLFSSPSPD